MKKQILLIALLFVGQLPLVAQTLVVTSTADSGAGSLREAVSNAPDGATITFSPKLEHQAIALTNQITISRNLNIDASGLANGLSISSVQIYQANQRVFEVNSNITVTLNSLFLTGSSAPAGSYPANCGGGILNFGALTLIACTLQNNGVSVVTNDPSGGAIENYYGSLTLSNCTISANDAAFGGAIENDGGTLRAYNSTFSGNMVPPWSTTINTTTTPHAGGAIYNSSGTVMANNCTFATNSATDGGAIVNDGGTLTLTQCTLAYNGASGTDSYSGGGAIDNYYSGKLYLDGCILAGNTAASGYGPDLWMEDGTLTAAYCLVGDGTSSTIANGANGNLVGTSGSPIAALLDPLGHYGGPTQTMPPMAGSPAVDAGDDSVTNSLATDQRGYPRLAGNQVDIGAVEARASWVTTVADSGPGSLRDAAANALNGTIYFSSDLIGQTITLTNGQITLDKDLGIDGSALTGAALANGIHINGNAQSRIFTVTNGAAVVLTSLTITNGSDSSGGGLVNASGCTLTVNNCTLAGNSATSVGGAINNQGILNMNNCTLAGNTGSSSAGGIENSGTLTVNNCTITANASSQAGGIENLGTLNLTNSIVSGNTGNPANLAGGFNGASNLVDVASLGLAPLGDYGGPTPTMLPLPGSPAINAGDDSVTNFLATDQRGRPRISDSQVDIGAVEFRPFTVLNPNDSGPGSLRDAIAAAPDRVTFAGSLSGQTIGLTSGQITITNPLEIDASGLAGGLTISGDMNSRIFDSSAAGVVLDSLTIANGHEPNTTLQANAGGGIVNRGNLTLNACTFRNNQTGATGGAIANNGGELGGTITATLTASNCTFSDNSSSSGGAIVNLLGALEVYNSTFSDNVASAAGGAIDNGWVATADNCTFSGNNISGNNAGDIGGAIYNEAFTQFFLNNCTLSGNAAVDGGAIYNEGGSLHLTNSIVAGNTALIWSNAYTGQLMTGSDPNLYNYGTLISDSRNLTNGIPLLAPLGNYGGLTQTMPPLAGSPAIDAGDDLVTSSFPTDQRGYPRLAGSHVDIGAVEAQIAPANNPPVLNHTAWSAAGGGNGGSSAGAFQFTFASVPNADFSVLTTTNLALPLNDWTPISEAVEMPPGSGQYQFTDWEATNYPQRFYQVVSP